MIKILKIIYSILINTTSITDIVGDKMFPDIAPDKDDVSDNVYYPLVIMRRAGIDVEYTKCNNLTIDTATVELLCYSTSYNEAVDLAEEIRTTLEFFKGTVDGVKIEKVRLTGITEDFTDGAYYQQLIFSIK